jgi:Ca-activated chloride channel family protein
MAAALLLSDCTKKPHSSSYHYAQKQIEHGDLDFHRTLRVNEYLNAFKQFGIELGAGQSIKLQIDPFTSSQPASFGRNFIQAGIKTRLPTAGEKRSSISLCFVLDVSGSMAADNKAKDALIALKGSVMELNNGDEFALILFAGAAEKYVPATVITPESRLAIAGQIDKITVGGGTDIQAGLMEGYREMAGFKNAGNKRLVLLTDGQSTVNQFAPDSIAKYAGVAPNPEVRISTIGLGISVEQDILRRIAEEGKGYYYFSESSAELTRLLSEELRTMVVPVADDVVLEIEIAGGVKVHACYGIPDSLRGRSRFTLAMGDMNVDEWRILIFEIEGDPVHWEPHPIKARLTYRIHGEAARQSQAAMAELGMETPGGGKPTVNKYVSRNSALFANALGLRKIGELAQAGKYNEAIGIVDLQLRNDSAVMDFGDRQEIEKELNSLKSVRAILVERRKGSNEGIEAEIAATVQAAVPVQADQAAQEKEGKLPRLLKTGAKLAIDALPGPWGTVAELLMILVE